MAIQTTLPQDTVSFSMLTQQQLEQIELACKGDVRFYELRNNVIAQIAQELGCSREQAKAKVKVATEVELGHLGFNPKVVEGAMAVYAH